MKRLYNHILKDNMYFENCEIAFGNINIVEQYLKEKKIIWINYKLNNIFLSFILLIRIISQLIMCKDFIYFG